MKTANKLFTCETCDKTFTTAVGLSRHKQMTKTHDYVKRNECNEIVYECKVCRQEFKNPQVLFVHRRRHDVEPEKTAQGASRSVLLTTTLAFIRVHDAVKSAFDEIRTEVFPLYAKLDDETPEAMTERIEQFLKPYSNFVNDGLQRDTFLVCDALIKDIQSL